MLSVCGGAETTGVFGLIGITGEVGRNRLWLKVWNVLLIGPLGINFVSRGLRGRSGSRLQRRSKDVGKSNLRDAFSDCF